MAGSEKPCIIITIEKLIWNTIFAVAQGNVDLLMAMENLAESFPWLESETENQINWVRHWFDGTRDCKVAAMAAMGVSGKSCSIFRQEVGGPTGMSVGDAEAEGEDKVDDVKGLMDDDGLYHGMDIDLLDAISPPMDGSRVIEPNHQPTISWQSHDHTSPLFTPEALPHQPLFLLDSEDEQNPIHLI